MGEEMVLTEKYSGFTTMKEYYCDFTNMLDEFSGVTNECEFMKHYILVDDHGWKIRCFAIRIPGGTVGSIWFDEHNKITKIYIDTNYVVKTYPKDINEIMKKYIGTEIEFDE